MKIRKVEMEVTKNRLANPDKLLRIAALVGDIRNIHCS